MESSVGPEVFGEELGPGSLAFGEEEVGGDVGALGEERGTNF